MTNTNLFNKNYDAVVVGAGISGATVAERLASSGLQVLVIEKKSHIAGNCYDFRDSNGICIHQYGTHIFHTNDKTVWDYLSQFTQWHPYTHKVLALIDGQLVPIPFNLNSIRQVFPALLANRIEEKLLNEFGFGGRTTILELCQKSDPDLKLLGGYVYEKVFLHYTLKQWDMKPEELDPAVTARVPIFVSRDDRYFHDKYQAIPRNGYTAMIERMLTHPNIELHLNTPFENIKDGIPENLPIYFSGPIDEYFNYTLGELPYRSVRFEFVEYTQPFFQPVACVNYPCNYDFTRIGEYKHFLNDKSDKTVISLEYPSKFMQGENERCYPISRVENVELYNRYLEEAKKIAPHIHFFGRLGDYKYYDMDKAVARALALTSGK